MGAETAKQVNEISPQPVGTAVTESVEEPLQVDNAQTVVQPVEGSADTVVDATENEELHVQAEPDEVRKEIEDVALPKVDVQPQLPEDVPQDPRRVPLRLAPAASPAPSAATTALREEAPEACLAPVPTRRREKANSCC